MELDNKKITIIILVLSVIIILHLGFTIWSYLQLRNKKGPQGKKGPRGPRGPSGR